MDFVTTDCIAEKFGLDRQAVRRHIRQGAINAIRVGRKYLVTQAEYERILREGLKPQSTA
jgi:excisionase family DNA binding protein